MLLPTRGGEMSYNKNEDITTAELNGIISIFQHFHEEKEPITLPNELNTLEDCTFQFTNGTYTNEEYIFEDTIECEIIKNHTHDLGEHYLLACKYYDYSIDPNDENTVTLQDGLFSLEPVTGSPNKYSCSLESSVIYMQLTNIILVTKYDNKIIVKAD